MTPEGTNQSQEDALRKLEKDGMEGLVESLLGSPDAHIRRHSAYLLGSAGNPDAIPFLLVALKDGDKAVREQAAHGLSAIGKDAALPLISLLRDHVWQTRYRAAEALGDIGDPRSIEPLVQALGDERDHVRYMAAGALGKMKSQYAEPFLIRLLGDENEFVRMSAVKALARIGGDSAQDAILKARLTETSDVVKNIMDTVLARAE